MVDAKGYIVFSHTPCPKCANTPARPGGRRKQLLGGGGLGAPQFLGGGVLVGELQKGAPLAGLLSKSFVCSWCACSVSHKGLRCWELDVVLI